MKIQINERAFLQDLPEANAVRLGNRNILFFFFYVFGSEEKVFPQGGRERIS